MANLREQQKAMTRRKLLTTALELFEAQGYQATTIDDIAGAAGTTRVTFYAHFESRRELMLALLAELNELLERNEASEHGPSSRQLVEAVQLGTPEAIRPWLRAQAAHWPSIRPYILAATEASASDPEARAAYHEWFESVISDIAEGLTRAERYPAATRRYRGELALAALDHTAVRWMREPFDIDTDPALEVLAEAWSGILGAAER